MKKLLMVFILTFSSSVVFGAQQSNMPNGLERCQFEVKFLKKIADEKCRMFPDNLYNGTGSAFSMVSEDVCRIASNEVVKKANACLEIVTKMPS